MEDPCELPAIVCIHLLSCGESEVIGTGMACSCAERNGWFGRFVKHVRWKAHPFKYTYCASNARCVTSTALSWARRHRNKTSPDLPENAISSACSFVYKKRDARLEKDAHLRLKFARLNGGHVIRLLGSSIRPLEHTSSPVCSAGVEL